MAFEADVRAGAAYVELFLVKNKFLRGLKSAQKKLQAFGMALNDIGRKLVATGALIAAPFLMAGKTFASFEDATKELQGVMQATDEEMKPLIETAKELAKTTSFGAIESMRAMVNLGRASYRTADIIKILPHMMNLARATAYGLAEATKVATDAMGAFELSIDSVEDVVDTLTAGTQNSKLNMEELGEALIPVSKIAFDAGASLRETVAAIGALREVGIKGSKAGRALARVYKELAKGPKIQKLRDLGIEPVDAQGNLKPVIDILKDVFNAVKNLGSQKKLEIFDMLFGRGQVAASALKTGKVFERINKILGNVAGTAARTAKKMDSGLGGAMRRARNYIELVRIEIGEALAPTLKEITEYIKKAAKAIITFVKNNKGLVKSVFKLALATVALGGALIGLGTTLQVVAFSMKGFLGVLSLVGGTLKGVTLLVAGILTPIGLIKLAVAGAIVAFLKFTSAGQNLVSSLISKLQILKDSVGIVFRAIGKSLMAGDIKKAGEILWQGLKITFMTGISQILVLWSKFKNYLLKVWIDLKTAIAQKWEDLWFLLQEIAIRNNLAKPVLDVFHGIEIAWQHTTTFFLQAWEQAVGGFLAILNRLKKAWSKVQGVIADGLVTVVAFMEDVDEDELRKSVAKKFAKDQAKLDANLKKIVEKQQRKINEVRKKGSKEYDKLLEKQQKRQAELKRLEKLGPEGRRAEALKRKKDIEDFSKQQKTQLEVKESEGLKKALEKIKGLKEEYKTLVEESTKALKNADKKLAGKVKKVNKAAVSSEAKLKTLSGGFTKGAFNISNILGLQGGNTEGLEKNTAEMVKKQQKTNQLLKGIKTPSFT